MAVQRKKVKLTLRTDPAIHARIAKAAKSVNMGINDLLDLILRLGLPTWEQRAKLAENKDAESEKENIKLTIDFLVELTRQAELWQAKLASNLDRKQG